MASIANIWADFGIKSHVKEGLAQVQADLAATTKKIQAQLRQAGETAGQSLSAGIGATSGQLREQMRLIEAQFRQATAELGLNASEADKLRVKAEALNRQLEVQQQVVQSLTERYHRAVAAKGETSREATRLATSLANAKAAEAELRNEIDRVNGELAKQTTAAGNLGERLRLVRTRLQGMYQAALPASQALAMAVAGLAAGIGALGVKAVTAAGQMEQTRIAFTTMLGSAQAAEDFIRQLRDFAEKTPFEFEGLEQASRRLLAFGFQAQEILPMMEAIGNAVAGLGGGAELIDRVTYALGQMQAKGKVSAEEMMQLAEAGIPAWQMLADAIGVSIPEAMKMAEQGAIPAAQAIDALITGMNEKFAGMMEKQAETIPGQWSNLKDSLGRILTSIGGQITETFNLEERLAGLAEAAGKIADLIGEKGLAGAFNELFPPERQFAIMAIAGAIAGALVPALWAAAAAAGAAIVPLLPFAGAGAAIAAVAYLIIKNWEPIKGFFTDLWDNVKRVTETVWEGIKRFLQEAWDVIKNIFILTNPILAVITYWDEIRLATTEAWTAIKDWLGATWAKIVEDVRAAWTKVKMAIGEVTQHIKDTFTNLVGAAWDWGKNLIGNLIDGIRSMLDRLREIASEIASAVADFLGFSSPTRLGPGRFADEWAPNLMKMFAQGLRAEIPRLEIAVGDVAARMAGLSPAALAPAIATSYHTSTTYGPTLILQPGAVQIRSDNPQEAWDTFERELRKRGIKF